MYSSSKDRKIILLTATVSTDSARLRLEQDVRGISEGLQPSQQSKPFHLEQRVAERPRDLQRIMLDVEPVIVHFSGDAAGKEGICFEDETGNASPIAGDMLVTLFALFAEQIQCVVLNRCYSDVQAWAIAQQIPYVVGIREIGDQAATEFLVSFYDAFCSGRSVEFAYKLSCNAIQLMGVPTHQLPVLLQSKTKVNSVAPAIAPSPAPPAGNVFNISGSNITNLTGSGAISYQKAVPPAPVIPHESADVQLVPSVVNPSTLPSPSVAPAPSTEKRSIEVFFSYSHRDEALRDEMAKHLSLLKRQNIITAWYDRDIGAGTEWAKDIDDHLNSAQVILLLISPDFIASDYCFDIEMQRAMERHEAGEAVVIPIILRPVDWSGAPFSKLQAFPIIHGGGAKAVTSWANRDEAFANVAQAIRKAVARLQ